MESKKELKTKTYQKIILLFLLFPLTTYAFSLVPCDGVKCSLCDLFVMINNIYQLLTWIAASFATGLIVYAGIQMIINSANPGKSLAARGLIIQTLIALAIVFGSSLIVNEVLRALAGSSATSDSVFHNFQCTSTSPNLGGEGLKKVTGGKVYLTRGTSDIAPPDGSSVATPSGGGNPTAASNEMNKLIGQQSITEYGATPGQACASGVSKAFINAGIMSRGEAQTTVGGLGSLLYTRKGFTTIITDMSQLRPGDVVFVKGSAGQPADSTTWASGGGNWGPIKSTTLGNTIVSRGEPGHIGMWTDKGFVNNRSPGAYDNPPPQGIIRPSTLSSSQFRFALRRQ